MGLVRRTWKKFLVGLKFVLVVLSVLVAFADFLLFMIFVLLFNLPIIRRSVFGRLPTDPRRRNWSKVENVEYAKGLKLDIFYPESYRSDNNKNVVLFAHGGGWITGYRRQPNNLSWYRFLLSRGLVVATIDYSRGTTASIERLIEELSSALKFLKRRFNVPVALLGLSAGGHLALLVASRCAELVSCVVAFYAPCDLLDIWESTSLFARVATIATLKRLPTVGRETYVEYSPVQHVHAGFPRALLVHGIRDRVVPFTSSLKMHKSLRRLGCGSRLLLHPQGDHGFEFVLRDERTRAILEETARFLVNCGREGLRRRSECDG